MAYYVGDKWPVNVGVAELPDDWDTSTFCVSIGQTRTLRNGDEAEITVILEKTDVPASQTDDYEGWLYGEVLRAETKDLAPGVYYRQVSKWEDGEPRSVVGTMRVEGSFKREECEEGS